MSKIKIGDRVKCLTAVGNEAVCNITGTVVDFFYNENVFATVKFDVDIDGGCSSSSAKDYDKYHWNVPLDKLEIVEEPRYTISEIKENPSLVKDIVLENVKKALEG